MVICIILFTFLFTLVSELGMSQTNFVYWTRLTLYSHILNYYAINIKINNILNIFHTIPKIIFMNSSLFILFIGTMSRVNPKGSLKMGFYIGLYFFIRKTELESEIIYYLHIHMALSNLILCLKYFKVLKWQWKTNFNLTTRSNIAIFSRKVLFHLHKVCVAKG